MNCTFKIVYKQDFDCLQSVLQDSNRMGPSDSFKEEFEIDLDENYQTITVPDFRAGRTGRFIHDFNAVSCNFESLLFYYYLFF